jgi:protease-4
MAKKRDIFIAIIIAFSFLATFAFFALMFFGAFASDDGFSLGGLSSKVAVVDITGTITESESIVKQLKKWGKSSGIKAIVLHIDSPGGGVAPSQEIYDEVLRIRNEEDKVIVASMSSLAASGGYYIACAAEKIMANPGTLTGSIGVIIQFYTGGKLLEKIGVEIERVKSGEMKDFGSIDRRLTDKEREMLSSVVMDTYDQFVNVVANNRGLDKNTVYKLADGSIFTGRQALKLGLVDTLGSFEESVRYAADLAGLQGEPSIVREEKPKKGLLDFFGSVMARVKEITDVEISGPRVMYLY